MYTYNDQQTVSTRELAWNKVGTQLGGDAGKGKSRVVDGPMTAAEALELSCLAGWDVRQVPLTTALGDHPGAMNDAGLIVPKQYATVATIDNASQVLGVVGNRYQVFQNEEEAELLDAIVDEGGAHFVAGGSLSDHRKTFMVMQLPKGILVGGEDASELFLGVTNSHDGTGSLVAWVTAVRLRCTNMLTSTVRGAQSKWRLRHTAGMRGKVEEARRSLELTFAWAEEFEAQAEEWLRTPFTEADFKRLLDEVEPPSDSKFDGWRRRQDEKRGALTDLFLHAETNELGRGTKWGAYNAFTEYADWFMPIKGDADGSRRAARTLDSSTVDAFKQRAHDVLVAV